MAWGKKKKDKSKPAYQPCGKPVYSEIMPSGRRIIKHCTRGKGHSGKCK